MKNLSIHFFLHIIEIEIIERCLRHTGTLPETNRKCSEQRSGPQKGNESSKHQFSGANLLVSGMFLVLAQHYVINSNYLLIEVLKKTECSFCFWAKILRDSFFSYSSLRLRLDKNQQRTIPAVKSISEKMPLQCVGCEPTVKWEAFLARKGGILDDEAWKVHGNCQESTKKKIKVNWHNPLRFTVNVIVLLEKARHVTALLHIFEKSVALMEK